MTWSSTQLSTSSLFIFSVGSLSSNLFRFASWPFHLVVNSRYHLFLGLFFYSLSTHITLVQIRNCQDVVLLVPLPLKGFFTGTPWTPLLSTFLGLPRLLSLWCPRVSSCVVTLQILYLLLTFNLLSRSTIVPILKIWYFLSYFDHFTGSRVQNPVSVFGLHWHHYLDTFRPVPSTSSSWKGRRRSSNVIVPTTGVVGRYPPRRWSRTRGSR